MASSEKFQILLKRLQEKSNRGQLGWTRGVKDDLYTVSFPSFSVDLSMHITDDLGKRYLLVVKDEYGDLVDSFMDDDDDFLAETPIADLYRTVSESLVNRDLDRLIEEIG